MPTGSSRAARGGSARRGSVVRGALVDTSAGRCGSSSREARRSTAAPTARASLISRASLRAAGRGRPDATAVDARRFRMLIEVDGVDAHAEDGWVGRACRIGGAVVRFHGHVGRCLITSRDPDTGVVDLPTLDLLGAYRGELDTTEPLPFGIYGEVRPGRCAGDRVIGGSPVAAATRVHGSPSRATDEQPMPRRVRIEIARPRRDRHADPARQAQRARPRRCSRRSSAPPSGCATEPGVRAVVLHGAGPSFCSGLDVDERDGRAGDGLTALVDRAAGRGAELVPARRLRLDHACPCR